MSSTAASGVHTLNIRVGTLLLLEQTGPDRQLPFSLCAQDPGACARIDVWDDGQTCPGMIDIEAKSSSSSKKPSTHDSGTDGPPPSTPDFCLPSSAATRDDTPKAAQRDLRRTRTAQLQSIYGLWSTCTCTCDVEDVLPTARCLDGDIFGVGKRPVQHEIEADGCVRLVFFEVDEIVD